MKTSHERLDDTKVKLTVEVEPERVKRAFDEAARHLAQGVQLKGFRKGKVPRKVLEAHVGKGAIAQHAMEDHLSAFYAEALETEELRPVAPPEIDLKEFSEEEGATFEATLEIRPEIELPPYEGIDVTFPEWEVTEDEVRAQLDQLRDRFAELEEVDRPAAIGDYVTIDLTVAKDGEPIEDATAEDALYEVGSGGVTPELDEQLPGAVAGQTCTYTDTLPEGYPEHGGEEVEFTVVVKDVRAKQLPELDDDFAATASEFDTFAELEDDIRRNLGRRKLGNARAELRSRILEAYLALVDVPLPEAMVESEIEARIGQVERQAERYGIDAGQLLEMQGTDMDTYRAHAEEQAQTTVKAQLVLEALASEVGVEVEPGDIEVEIQRHAMNQGVEPGVIARAINEQGSVGVLVGDVVRRKALDTLVAAAEVVDEPSDEVIAELEAPEAPVAEDVEPHEPDLGGDAEPVAAAAEDEVVYGDEDDQT